MDGMEDGRKRREQFCSDWDHDIWMGWAQLTAFKALCYGSSVLWDPMVRGKGDTNTPLRMWVTENTSRKWLILHYPPAAQATAFSSCQRAISLQPHIKCSPSELRHVWAGCSIFWWARLCVPQWEQSGDSQLKMTAHELSSSWKRRIGSWHHSFALQSTHAVHGSLVRERVPSFIWRVPKCSFSVAAPLKPQGSHLHLLAWQPC